MSDKNDNTETPLYQEIDYGTPQYYAARTGVKVWFDFENNVLCIGFTDNGKTCRFEEYLSLATARELRDKLNQHVAALEALGKAE